MLNSRHFEVLDREEFIKPSLSLGAEQNESFERKL